MALYARSRSLIVQVAFTIVNQINALNEIRSGVGAERQSNKDKSALP